MVLAFLFVIFHAHVLILPIDARIPKACDVGGAKIGMEQSLQPRSQFLVMGVPPVIIHFHGMFPYKPSINRGTPMEPPMAVFVVT